MFGDKIWPESRKEKKAPRGSPNKSLIDDSVEKYLDDLGFDDDFLNTTSMTESRKNV
jgi:hypothetical protein